MRIRRKACRDHRTDTSRHRGREDRQAVFSHRTKTLPYYKRHENPLRAAPVKKRRIFRKARQQIRGARYQYGGVTVAVLAILALSVIMYLGLEMTTGVCAQWVLNGYEWWCADWSARWTLFGYPIG